MDSTTDQPELEYLLGVGAAAPTPTNPAAPPAPFDVAASLSAAAPTAGVTVPAVSTSPAALPVTNPVSNTDGVGTGSDVDAASRKRKADDKQARQTKRKMRNRELARASNAKRRQRIETMEKELKETRKTVSTLEESIKCLEAENKELINLLQSKPDTPAGPNQSTAPASAPTATAPVVQPQQPSTATQ